METLGQRIRRLREERQWTQAQLADLIGTTGRTVGNWERDEVSPRNRIGALEKAFGISLTDGRPLHNRDDKVVDAIESSPLSRGDRAELISHYWRLLDAGEGRGSA